MSVKKSTIIPLIILILVSSRVNAVIRSGNWGVTQFEELRLEYTWVINNFELVTLKNQSTYIESPKFSPPGNESFKWHLQLYPQSPTYSSFVELYLQHSNDDTVQVNYTLSIGSRKSDSLSRTFIGNIGWGYKQFFSREFVFESILPNGTLIVNCEIRAISNIVEASGANFDQCTSMRDVGLGSQIGDDLLTLLEDETFSDVTIKSEEHEIRAHKFILAARSPVLASLIMQNSTLNSSGNSSFIEIKDMNSKVLKKLLQYIYTDKVDGVNSNMAKDLLAAAIKYDIKGLKARCEEILCSGMNYENVIEILEIANQYYIHKLKLQANKFIAEHALTVIHSAGFKNLETTKPHPFYEILRIMAYKSIFDHGTTA